MSERLLIVGNLAKDIVNKQEYFGGSAANLALGAKKLGLNVGIMSVLGKDMFSLEYYRYLNQNGVDTALIQNSLKELPVCEVISNVNSILSSVWKDNDCHPKMEVMKLDTIKINSYDLVHLVSCPPKLAKNINCLGLQISFEPGPLLMHNPNYFDLEVARKSTFIFLNNEEKQSVDKNFPKELQNLNSYEKLSALIVTLGENGADLYKKVGKDIIEIHIPATKLNSKFIDATGAGDNFKAGFLSGFLKNRSLEQCVKIGNDMGAASVTQSSAILSKEIVDKIKEKYHL